MIGHSAGQCATVTDDGICNVILGVGRQVYGMGNVARNITIGTCAGYRICNGDDNIFVGTNSGYNTCDGSNYNVFIGRLSGCCNTTGDCSVFIGVNG